MVDPMQIFLQTAMLIISIALPIAFVVLTFTMSASFFRFVAAATFAISAWYLYQRAALGGDAYQWIATLYVGLAVMMPFAKIARKNATEDMMDNTELETSLDRYAARLAKNDAKYAKLRSLGRKRTIRRNPYEEGEEEV